MEYSVVDLPKIAIIGKVGLCTKEKNIVQDLWQEANTNFGEVAHLAMKDQKGAIVGIWGAMSDESLSYLPWTDHFSKGLYLAGIEVYEDTEAPKGWTKWILPARRYIVVDVNQETYGGTFDEVIGHLIPELHMKLSGAACDFTEPLTGQNKIFFPVEEAAL